jgi:hypothetical protein
MGLRFSRQGPEFPSPLIDAIQKGEVVFLCGAGVSAPQLPLFDELVRLVYEDLQIKPTAGENLAIGGKRFEEALGSLSRNLSDSKLVERTVSKRLTFRSHDLRRHQLLLRLSRNLDNRIVLVTTNFDTFFEHAIEQVEGTGQSRSRSLGGQALPPPGSEDFSGVIHLHGRIADKDLNLDATPLVLQSSEYGDAYMRSGWASRFLFDLARVRTIVLIGYGAGDAPVRYFLNVLHSDRSRFADLRTVYALDGAEHNVEEVHVKWETVAVEPIPFVFDASDLDRFEVLWRDLESLAKIIERPKQCSEELAKEIFGRPFSDASESELATATWLVENKHDLWTVVIKHVTDPQWFDFFREKKLWTDETASWVIASWCWRDWSDTQRLLVAIQWSASLGKQLGTQLELRLSSSSDLKRPYSLAWTTVTRTSFRRSIELNDVFRTAKKLGSSDHIDSELRDAISAITPRISLRSRYTPLDDAGKPPSELTDLVHVSLKLDHLSYIKELVDALAAVSNKHPKRVSELALDALRCCVEDARDAGMLAILDELSRSVPSVEAHQQNAFHDGVVWLVTLQTTLLPHLARQSKKHARALAEAWRGLPGELGIRMWLHALSNADLYDADEVADAILALPHSSFWHIRRELIVAMEGRLSKASKNRTNAICERIIREAPDLFQDYEGGSPDQTDWRPQVRAQYEWLRLTALERAGVISDEGIEKLASVADTYPYFKGSYEESDLFTSYITGPRAIQGNPSTIQMAQPQDRLTVAQQLSKEWDPISQRSWGQYCLNEPRQAFEVLASGPRDDSNVSLWRDFLNALRFWQSNQSSRTEIASLTKETLEIIGVASDDFVKSLTRYVVDVLRGSDSLGPREVEKWWDRLWSLCEGLDDASYESDIEELYDRAIAHPEGQLTELLLIKIDERRKANLIPTRAQKSRLSKIATSKTRAATLSRCILAKDAGFLWHIDSGVTLKKLMKVLLVENSEGKALRSLLMQRATLGPQATNFLREVLLKGARECSNQDTAENLAALLLRPLINLGHDEWGITSSDVHSALIESTPDLLRSLAQWMHRWIGGLGMSADAAWGDIIEPIFDRVWPKQRRFNRSDISHELACLCISAGNAFPNALERVKPHLLPSLSDGHGLYFIKSSTAPTDHPRATLDLLWILRGPSSRGSSFELGSILDVIVKAEPALEIDRRFQWLEGKAIRY